MTDHKDAPETRAFGLTEGLLIAGIPAVGYWLSYLYEYGYCKFFGIPVSYIELGVSNIFSGMLGATGILIMLWLFADTLFQSGLPRLPSVVRWSLYRIIFVLFLVGTGAIIFSWSASKTTVIFLGVLILLIFIEFILPLISQRTTKGFIRKLEAQRKSDFEVDSLMDIAARGAGPTAFLAVFWLFIASVFAWGAGGLTAATQKVFWVVADDSSAVIIRHYGSNLLTRKVHYCAKSVWLSPNVLVLPAQGSNPVSMIRKELDLLTVNNEGDADCEDGPTDGGRSPF